MSDLETRVRDELMGRAATAGPWRTGGAELRRAAGECRARRRRRSSAVLVAATGLAVALSIATWSGTDASPPPPVDRATDPPRPDPAWLEVALSPEMTARAVEAVGGDSGTTTLLSRRLPRSGGIVALLANTSPNGAMNASTVTFDSAVSGARVRRGTTARYSSVASLIAQPAYDGDEAVLLVALPRGVQGDTVEVTTSEPGQDLVGRTQDLQNGVALVPVSAPQWVTRLIVLRQGQRVVDTVPAASLLGRDVPRTIARVVASEDRGRPYQPVQVRTDGQTACRVTAGGFWLQGGVAIHWNVFDAACAPVDGRLHLMLAEDRRYSSVAGLAPPGTTSVRLYWRSGDDSAVTDVPVTTDSGVTAFVDTSGRRPDQLVRAEATRAGDVIETVLPPT